MIKREMPFFLALPALMWQFLFVCVPLALTVYTSLHRVSSETPWYIVTLDHYAAIFTLPHFLIIGNSLLLALLTVSLCLFIGYPVAYFLALYAGRWRTILLFLLTLPFWTNFLTQAYAWFFILDKQGLINRLLLYIGLISKPWLLTYNWFAVICVMVYCFLPFMIVPIYSVLQKFDWRLLEASQDLGATRWQTFIRITIPLSKVGIQTGCLLVFIPACGEFIIPMIMGGSRYMYIGSTITHYILTARNEHLGAAFTVLSGIALLSSIALGHLYLRVIHPVLSRR
jgi:spermidine/putrescine transport system permease protein